MTLIRTAAAETAISEAVSTVHNLLRTGGVPVPAAAVAGGLFGLSVWVGARGPTGCSLVHTHTHTHTLSRASVCVMHAYVCVLSLIHI